MVVTDTITLVDVMVDGMDTITTKSDDFTDRSTNPEQTHRLRLSLWLCCWLVVLKFLESVSLLNKNFIIGTSNFQSLLIDLYHNYNSTLHFKGP